MVELGTQALGAAFEPIKEWTKKFPIPVALALLGVYALPWARIRLACYGVALEHPGALFYAFISCLVLLAVLTIALSAWRKDRMRRHALTKRRVGSAQSEGCSDPSHSLDNLALYEKLENGGALWDIQLFGHQKGGRPQVQEIKILGDAAYCKQCVNTALTYGFNKMLSATWWICSSCSARIPHVSLEGQRHGAKAVAFARFKKDNPTALNNARTAES